MSPPAPGEVRHCTDGLRCVLAPNPGPMTHWGTNTFILGEGDVAIVDPGPDLDQHLAALLQATKGEHISHILVTHAHADHSPLARRLSNQTGAPVLAFGPADAGRSKTMNRLAAQGIVGGGEGVDMAFSPDQTLREGDQVSGGNWTVDVLHTPGHFAGHLAFAFEQGIISGDHVMDWSSSLVSPPDGDLAAFMATSRRLRDLGASCLFPGHGAAINDPSDRLGWLIQHRLARETDILNALSAHPQTIAQITGLVYTDIPKRMHLAAARNVLAHLIDLVDRNLALADPQVSVEASFTRL